MDFGYGAHMKSIRINDREIGLGQPVYIVAEAGINHNGDMELAKRMIDVAKETGADAIKFQAFKTEELLSKKYLEIPHHRGKEDLFDLVKSTELSQGDFEEISKHAKKRKITFFSSALDKESADFLLKLNVPIMKIASCDLTNIPLISYIAKLALPIILSTGMASLGEIEEALNTMHSCNNEKVILLHCVSSYPAPIEEVNLRVINTLSQIFQVPVGFSDHTHSLSVPIVAVALGARVIEKHLTLDKKMPGPDHKASADPEEFGRIVEGIREVELALGSFTKKPTQSEEKIKKAMRRSIVARKKIRAGTKLTEEMLSIKRPGTGIPPNFLEGLLGKTAKRDIPEDEVIKWDMIS